MVKVESLHKIADHKSLIRFSVIDSGLGIDEGFQKQIFQAFDQGDPLTNKSGTGLGLSISKRLVDFMHGSMGIESTPSKGSTFWFDIPLAEADHFEKNQQAASEEKVIQLKNF